MDYSWIRKQCGRRAWELFRDWRVGERDPGEWFVVLRFHDGFEQRISATSEAEARGYGEQIARWARDPASRPGPRPWPVRRAAQALALAAPALIAFAAAWDGFRNFWLVDGFSVVLAGLPCLALSIVYFTVLLGRIPLERRPPLWTASPLIFAFAIVLAIGAKSANARLGSPRTVDVDGVVVAMDDASFSVPQRRRRSVRVVRFRLRVEDAARRRYVVEVPGWIAEREKLSVGAGWRDRYYVGRLGWAYRRGPDWDGFDFVPRATAAPVPLDLHKRRGPSLRESVQTLRDAL